jgi:hypothetical protein
MTRGFVLFEGTECLHVQFFFASMKQKKKDSICSLETAGTAYPATHRDILEDWNRKIFRF